MDKKKKVIALLEEKKEPQTPKLPRVLEQGILLSTTLGMSTECVCC